MGEHAPGLAARLKAPGVHIVRRGAWMVDGKRVNPDRPTDLAAPAWEPFPEG